LASISTGATGYLLSRRSTFASIATGTASFTVTTFAVVPTSARLSRLAVAAGTASSASTLVVWHIEKSFRSLLASQKNYFPKSEITGEKIRLLWH